MKLDSGPVALLAFVLILHSVCGQTNCPWDEQNLQPWSDPNTWTNNRVPVAKDKVVIPKGKRVLLNVQPPVLSTLFISDGAALIWGNIDGIILQTEYIFVQGEFWIGSETCRFDKKARIKLIGLTNSSYSDIYYDFGAKFIGVPDNGTLELHGKQKTSWTRLAQTIPTPENVYCGLVYDHSKTLIGRQNQDGLQVIIWNEDGTVFDFQVFSRYGAFSDFFQTIPNNKVIAMLAVGASGIGNRGNSDLSIDQLERKIVDLGGSVIRSVNEFDSYSFIARKGDTSSVREYFKIKGQQNPDLVRYLHVADLTRGLDFQVAASSIVPSQNAFRVLPNETAFPIITLAVDVTGWDIGDEIVVASTDYDWRQAEVRRVIQCSTCSKNQVRVNESFSYQHYGNFTYNIDQRAEVGLLTRSIVIEGVMEPQCYSNNDHEKKMCDRYNKDTFGGHIKVELGHKRVRVEGVELYHMGQQSLLARYPLHIHMCDEVYGDYLRNNSVHEAFSRCITIHGSHGLDVSDNVCYDHIGHGIFLEDNVEQNNTIYRNLALGTQYGTLLMSDSRKEWCAQDPPHIGYEDSCQELATYWITHPNNEFVGNVAAGGDGHGYKILYADIPISLSYARQQALNRLELHRPWNDPLKKFDRNTAHSNANAGISFDDKLSSGQEPEKEKRVPLNGILRVLNDYDPRVPPTANGQRVWAEISRMTLYKNRLVNAWIKAGNVRMTNCSFADSPEGFTGGNTNTDTATEVVNSIFIGQTNNTGLQNYKDINNNSISYAGRPTDSLTAVSLFQGPNIVRRSYFDRYVNVNFKADNGTSFVRYGGAISWKRSNPYPTMTSSYVQDLTFGYCDNVTGGNWVFHGSAGTAGWDDLDGNKGPYVRDADGSLTGNANSSLVQNSSFYTGPECVYHDNWGMSVCPYRYIKMEISGDGGNLNVINRQNYPISIRRDDFPTDILKIKGTQGNQYLLRTQKSYLVDFNTSFTNAAFPNYLNIYGYGVESGDAVRVGICQSLTVTSFNVTSDYPVSITNNVTWVANLTELDKDKSGYAFYHDKGNGILYFKILSFHTRTNDSQRCPAGFCFNVKIVPIYGSSQQMRSCFYVENTPFSSNSIYSNLAVGKPCSGPASPPQGLGAVDWSQTGFISQNDYSSTCRSPDPEKVRGPVVYQGCFTTQSQIDLSKEPQELSSAMTRRWCTDRCFRRGHKYSAVTNGLRCVCGQVVNMAQENQSQNCNSLCSGNSSESCGGTLSFDVTITGSPEIVAAKGQRAQSFALWHLLLGAYVVCTLLSFKHM